MESNSSTTTPTKELRTIKHENNVRPNRLEQTEDNAEIKSDELNIYEVKFICRDDYQYTGQDITDYNDYVNPLGKAVYIHAKNASEALSIAVDEILKEEIKNGYEIADIHENYLLLINEYGEYLEFQRGIATVISPQQ